MKKRILMLVASLSLMGAIAAPVTAADDQGQSPCHWERRTRTDHYPYTYYVYVCPTP